MSTEDIPKEVVDFLARHVDSVVQLEVLLLLHASRDTDRTAGELARELRIDPAWAEAALAKHAAAGILEHGAPSTYRYAPKSRPLEQTVAALAQQYESRRVSVISLIFSKPADPIRQFTDAFRFKQKPGDPNPQQES